MIKKPLNLFNSQTSALFTKMHDANLTKLSMKMGISRIHLYNIRNGKVSLKSLKLNTLSCLLDNLDLGATIKNNILVISVNKKGEAMFKESVYVPRHLNIVAMQAEERIKRRLDLVLDKCNDRSYDGIRSSLWESVNAAIRTAERLCKSEE